MRATVRWCPPDLQHAVPCKHRASVILATLPRRAASIRFLFVEPIVCLARFLQIRGRPRHLCRSATTSPCRVWRRALTSQVTVPPPQRVGSGASRRRTPYLAHKKSLTQGVREAKTMNQRLS